MHRSQASVRLIDSEQHGPACELLLVEGESAAQSAASVRCKPTQAVLPLQGKPLNAWRASAERVQASALHGQLAAALGLRRATAVEAAELDTLRFGRLVLLFDPDADGIHIGALVLLYLRRWLPELLQRGMVWMVRPPIGAVERVDAETGEITVEQVYGAEHLRRVQRQAREQGGVVRTSVYRGLGSMPPAVLHATCVDPATRHAHPVSEQDLRVVQEVFGGS